MRPSKLILMMPDWGCYTTVSDFEGKKCLLAAPMLENGGIEMQDGEPNWCDVSDPDSQAFLDDVNKHFGTDFTMARFGF